MIKAYTYLMEHLPLLGAAGSILLVLGGILGRIGACHNISCFIQGIQPTADEYAQMACAVGLLRQHFKHQDIAKQ